MKVLSFGELLLRLAAPSYTRFLQKDSFDATFCGAEANVAVSLSLFGLESVFLTKLPENEIGVAAMRSLQYFGVNTDCIVFGDGRMGLYYLEKGASQRPSKVIYDRKNSAVALSENADYNWDKLFEGVDWFHFTGITPALSDNLSVICKEACMAARKKGIMVSCDLNYRKKLWSTEKAKEVMSSLMKYVDVCIANEEDAEKVLGISPDDNNVNEARLNKSGYELTAKEICQKYGCKYVGITLRESYSASVNGWSCMLYDRDKSETVFSSKYDIQIIDRVGSGDSFTAGLIYGLINGKSNQETVEFAAAASCLKHSVEGDYNRVTVEEVESLIRNGGSGRVQR